MDLIKESTCNITPLVQKETFQVEIKVLKGNKPTRLKAN